MVYIDREKQTLFVMPCHEIHRDEHVLHLLLVQQASNIVAHNENGRTWTLINSIMKFSASKEKMQSVVERMNMEIETETNKEHDTYKNGSRTHIFIHIQ